MPYYNNEVAITTKTAKTIVDNRNKFYQLKKNIYLNEEQQTKQIEELSKPIVSKANENIQKLNDIIDLLKSNNRITEAKEIEEIYNEIESEDNRSDFLDEVINDLSEEDLDEKSDEPGLEEKGEPDEDEETDEEDKKPEVKRLTLEQSKNDIYTLLDSKGITLTISKTKLGNLFKTQLTRDFRNVLYSLPESQLTQPVVTQLFNDFLETNELRISLPKTPKKKASEKKVVEEEDEEEKKETAPISGEGLFTNLHPLHKKLLLLTGSKHAGNDNTKVEINKCIDKMYRNNMINKDQHKQLWFKLCK